MEPNNNQPINTNPVAQPVSQSVPATEASLVTPAPEPTVGPEASKGKGNKVIILLVILLLLAIGMIVYILFAKDQLNKVQKEAVENSSVITPSPSPTLVPTLAPEEDLEVASPEADLLELDADVRGL